MSGNQNPIAVAGLWNVKTWIVDFSTFVCTQIYNVPQILCESFGQIDPNGARKPKMEARPNSGNMRPNVVVALRGSGVDTVAF